MKDKIKYLFVFVFFIMMSIYFNCVSFDYALSDIAPHLYGAINADFGDVIYSITPQRTLAVTYPLYHYSIKLISIFISDYALVNSIVLTGYQLLTFIVILHIVKPRNSKDFLFTLGLMLIVGFSLNFKLYLPQGSPNVWHSPTYIVMRPFALLSVYYFLEILNDKSNIKNILYFSVNCFISCLAKPSFTIVFLPVAGLICLVDILKNIKLLFAYGIKMFISVLPTLILLLVQYCITINDSTGIVFRLGGFQNLVLISIVLSTVMILIFPISNILLNKNINKKEIVVSLLIYMMGWFQYFFLDESQYNHGNFAWGYYMSIFVLYIYTFKNISDNKIVKIIMLIQIIFGLLYFIIVFMMKGYMW